MKREIPRTNETQDFVSITSNVECQPNYFGALDFAFIVHARTAEDLLRAYPHLREHTEEIAFESVRPKPILVGSYIHVEVGKKLLRGELIGIPFLATEFRRKLPEIRDALKLVLNYCSHRQTKIVGLGGLLPSVTRHGHDLLSFVDGVGITTGHSFTAHVIAEQVLAIKRKFLKIKSLAILGAAGSMGQATTKLLLAEKVADKFTLIDVHPKLGALNEMKSKLNRQIQIETTSELSALKKSEVIICVTNSPSALIQPEHLSSGCIIIDDAQPPNVTHEVARAAGATVLKCLAQVPRLKCPFDFGIFPKDLLPEKQNIVFTCLAETLMLAAHDYKGHFTIGHPTGEQLKIIAGFSHSLGITVAPFHSFPEIGEVNLNKQISK